MIEEQAAEQARQHADGQKEARAAGDPTLTVRGEATARHHTMQMGMIKQVLSPTVQHREETYFRAQVLGISSDGA